MIIVDKESIANFESVACGGAFRFAGNLYIRCIPFKRLGVDCAVLSNAIKLKDGTAHNFVDAEVVELPLIQIIVG